MNLWIFVDDTGRVSASQLSDKPMPSPWIDTHLTEYPQPPNADEANGIFYEMAWRGGKIVWDAVKTDYREPPTEEPASPTHAEIEALRAAAYRDRVDPLTCQIQRMEDMGAAASEIDALRAVRDATFYAIQREFPYA